MSRAMPSDWAETIVPARSASIGVMPPRTNDHNSQCEPMPACWPCAPIDTGMPRAATFRASRALFVVDEIVLGRLDPPRALGEQLRRRGVRLEQGMLVDVGRLAPVGIAGEPAIGHHQGRRVIGLAAGPKVEHVLVEGRQRDIVLERRIAVGDQRHVHPEQRPALGDDLHILAPGGLDHLLALLAARLVVILDAARALRLQPPDVRQRIVEAVDLGIDVGRLGAVDDLAGREDARADDLAGPLQLGRGEDLARPRRRVVDRGRAEREILVQRPILLRDDFVVALRAVGVGVDQPGDDRLAAPGRRSSRPPEWRPRRGGRPRRCGRRG